MGELPVIKFFSIRLRLILLLLIPSLLYLGSSVYLLQVNKSNTDTLTSSLYETTEKSVSLILNADRDMYQAMNAYQLLVSGTLTAEEKTNQLKLLNDNIEQTNTRVGQAVTILKSKELLQTAHAETKVTIEQSASSFQTSFDQWVKEANAVIQAGSVGKGF
jgi:methyl-accepting chemotaxis protein